MFNPTMTTYYPCTTHVPLFIPAPTNPTLTRYSATITGTSTIDCGGCSLKVEEVYNWGVLPSKTVKPTVTITMPSKYTLTYACEPTTRKPKGWWGDGG
ncbi:hypothetical protein L228DRAFT_86014 [Xylona heveae TC161]|uniref:Uncharacterized protein n=1 Tax=Xylona heveae (strain CBS 132557 / TC161) TaxID=1328760 RepID=A0A165HVG4_XYLHT|nr:hypothetical protein L228DRAFT_86014 [Xylona heveae TC161]KZF23978.1 hypothetical protein L228DRAFT_86014 [Xylona heveae TC161]